MEKFLDRYQEPKLNQDQVNDLNSLIFPKEIEAVINRLQTKKKKKKKKKKNKTKKKTKKKKKKQNKKNKKQPNNKANKKFNKPTKIKKKK